jgi:3-dehydroquinate synthase
VVRAAAGEYPILIGAGACRRLPAWIREQISPSSVLLVSDRRVFSLHGRRAMASLERLDVPIHRAIVPAGEPSKSPRQLESIWRRGVQAGLDRRACVVALGGGVVGDLAGFAAATILRGVPLVQVPTSLLAMVDSSVGGKTGINLPEGKNLVGAFHAPRAVFIDTSFLTSLPRRQMRAGWAEIIKAAVIRDAAFFRALERGASHGALAAGRGLEAAIRSACRIKAEVVGLDEREAGLRMTLNFGHTLGHGLEAALGYRGLLHGEAVAIGMVFAARLGVALGLARPETSARLEALLRAFGLPLGVPRRLRVDVSKVLDAMARDKKRGREGPRWVLVPEIGRSEIVEGVPWAGVRAAVRHFLQESR